MVCSVMHTLQSGHLQPYGCAMVVAFSLSMYQPETAPGSELQCALPLGYQQHPSSVIDIETLFAVRVLTISAFAQTHHLPDHSYGGPAGPQKFAGDLAKGPAV